MALILIAEPSRELHPLFVRAVERLGHEPVPLASDDELTPPPADIVLLDPDWPSGVAAARALGVPVIVCSTRGPTAEGEYPGAVAHLVKPFSHRQLARAVGAALIASRGQQLPH